MPGIGASYWTTFFPAAVILGVGLAVLVPAVTTVALDSVEARHSGLASAINNAFAQVAGLLAVAALGVLMFAVFDGALDARLAELDLPPATRAEVEAGKVELGPHGRRRDSAPKRARPWGGRSTRRSCRATGRSCSWRRPARSAPRS